MAQNNFDFDSYNKSIKTAGTGLKLFLAVGLMRDVLSTLERFDNPLEDDCRSVVMELKKFRADYQQAAKDRADKTGKLMASDGQSE